MTLSELEALEICRDLWQWMADGKKKSAKDKEKWPEWKCNGGKILCNHHHCPLCMYITNTRRNKTCINCPLLGLWGGTHKPKSEGPCAYNEVSPYYPFAMEEPGGTPSDALKIVKACKERIKELGG